MFEGHHHTIFDLLASRALIEPAALKAALEEHHVTGKEFASLLIEGKMIEKSALLQAVAEHLGCDYADKLPEGLPPETIGSVDGGLAKSYGVMPVAKEGSTLTLLAADPFNPHLANDLAFALACDVRLAVTDPANVHRLIKQYYGDSSGSADAALINLADSTQEVSDTRELTEADIEKMAGQTPIIRLVNLVLAQAIRDRASDIHFEPFAREFKIRYRIDGRLCEMAPPARSLALPIISRLKVMANLNIAERRLPQDGRITLNLGGRAVDLRISTLPTQFGESVVLRVLDQSSGQLELSQIGLPTSIQSRIEETIRRPNGIFIVTGPTGSGKTTTLYSCLKLLNTVDAKLISVEDPVEYEIDGVMQVPVNPAAGLSFAKALRTFLRQDPDILMVGEIRDFETAQIAIQAALTGHLVLTTLHTNDAAGAVTRLVDMGIEPFLLSSTIEAVLAQRLLRRICTSCRITAEPSDSVLRQAGFSRESLSGQQFYSGVGCSMCDQTGYKGRIGIFEFLRITEPLRELVMQGASLVQLRKQAIVEGMTTLREAGMRAIFAGETTLDEVVKYT